MITIERLREVLDYDPETGNLIWRVRLNSRAPVGAIAGCICKHRGYRVMSVDKRFYPVHRLIWLHVHGVWPANEIDHVNGIKHDNRISNLREATHAQNCRNIAPKKSKSGAKGVRYNELARKWQARIVYDHKEISLGYFHAKDAAIAAREAAELQYFGEFRRSA
jgi:hypothetical protein